MAEGLVHHAFQEPEVSQAPVELGSVYAKLAAGATPDEADLTLARGDIQSGNPAAGIMRRYVRLTNLPLAQAADQVLEQNNESSNQLPHFPQSA